MPYVIVSTVAILSNLYKNAPLIVGDKDSDPDLMRFLGARMTTNYPACGSPPMYVMHAPPRTVFDNLEKRGYCLMSAQTIQEHSVWILARPRVPDDDKVEIARGGPNDKSVQAFEEPEEGLSPTPSRTPSVNRSRSPSKTPRIKITRSSSKQTLNEDLTLNNPESQRSKKSSPIENQAFHLSYEKLNLQDEEYFRLRKSPKIENLAEVQDSSVSRTSSQTMISYLASGKSDSQDGEETSLNKSSQAGSQSCIVWVEDSFAEKSCQTDREPSEMSLSLDKYMELEISLGETRSDVGTQVSEVLEISAAETLSELEQVWVSGSQKHTSEDGDARSASHDSWSGRDKSPNNVMFSVLFRESSPRRKSSHGTRKILENQKLSVEIIENEPKRRKSHRIRKILDLENPRSRSVSPDKKGTTNTSPSHPNKSKETVQQAEKRKEPNKERTWTRVCCDNDPFLFREPSPLERIQYGLYEDNQHGGRSPQTDNKHSFGEEDSQKILPSDKKDPGNVTSRGDAGTNLLESEKVHMGIQASDSEVSLKISPDIMSRVSFNARKQPELLKNSNESTENQSTCETNKIKSALKRTLSLSKQIQADINSDLNIKPRKTGITVRFANSKDGLDSGKSLTLDPSIPDIQGIIDLYSLAGVDTGQKATASGSGQGSQFLRVEESSTIVNEGNILQNSVILRSLASRCSHIAVVDDVDTPMFIDITDPTIRSCLTHENCCCEES